MADHLCGYLEESARQFPERPAVCAPDGSSLSYAELNRQSEALSGFLVSRGVLPGDRVGVVLPKSIEAVVSLFAVMKAGAAYVPVDYTAPAERTRGILSDCEVRAVIDSSGVTASGHTTQFKEAVCESSPTVKPERTPDDLAYILYTSGSTGIPKGVMLTHRNAVSFVDWATAVFHPSETDRFSSHAPFHFDLSVLDLYVAVKHGASVYLIPEDLGKNPKDLARFIAATRLTIWYSTPSILTLLMQLGHLEKHDCSSLRLVLFAGEVFPVKHLRDLQKFWPYPEYYNLYGPTETNVCTFALVPSAVPDDREQPYPIGFACSHCDAMVLEDGSVVPEGTEGLLYISGPSVFSGYWNRPVENATAFLDRDGSRWYNTGDVVRAARDGFTYVGRKDRMVKRRGYRIELGEIERALYSHAELREVAVVSIPDSSTGVQIVAFLSCNGQKPSIIALKTFCSHTLPAYMSPDRFVFHDRLPRTSTDKVDYQALKRQLSAD